MADYSADLNTLNPGTDGTLGDFGANVIWWFSTELPNIEAETLSIALLDYDLGGTGAELLNPSFELPNGIVEGYAESWALAQAAIEWAWWVGSSRYPSSDTFEAQWSDNEDALPYFDDDTDLSFATFGTLLETVETFEREWKGNQNSYHELPASIDWLKVNAEQDAAEGFELEWPARHPTADNDTEVQEVFLLPSQPSEIMGRINAAKLALNTHMESEVFHKIKDVVHLLTSPDATDLASACTLAAEAWEKVWLHVTDATETYHRADTGEPMKAPDLGFSLPPTTWGDLSVIANYLTVHANLHATWASCSGKGAFAAFVDWGGSGFYDILPPPEVETFEFGWRGNENSLTHFAPTDLTLDEFRVFAGGTEPVETFEEPLAVEVPTTPGGEGAPTTVDPSAQTRANVTGSFDGDLRLESCLRGSSTWVERGTVSIVPPDGANDIGEGHERVRFRCVSYTSGSPVGQATWQPLR